MSGPSVPMPYQPTGQASADQGYQSLYGGALPYAQSLPGQVIPGVQQAVGQITASPYAAGYQTAANQAGQAAGGVAGQQLGGAQALYGAGQQALSQGFDPQNALYNRQFQQLMDQQNAINSASGLGQTPYGAGVTGQAAENFNLDWLNSQLGREQTASNIAGQNFQGASNLGLQGLNTTTQAGAIPYGVGTTIANQNIGAYNALSGATQGALQPGNQLMNELATYLGIGQSATGLAQAGEAQQFQQGQSVLQGIGSTLGSIFGQASQPSQSLFGYNLWG